MGGSFSADLLEGYPKTDFSRVDLEEAQELALMLANFPADSEAESRREVQIKLA